MPCFCEAPASAARNRWNVALPVLAPPPLSLRMTAAVPALLPQNRLDVQIATGLESMRLPNLVLGGGPMAQLALSLSMMTGAFSLGDLPKLEIQMEQSANSIARNVWPRLGWLTTLSMPNLLNYSLIARLVLDLEAMGLDPLSMEMPPPAAPVSPNFRFALSRPQLNMAKLLAGLPSLFAMNEALALPPLGDTAAMSAMQNRLNGMANLSPPSLVIPLPMLTKLAMVLEALATIDAAFGDPFSPATWQKIDASMRWWSRLPLSLPMPALALQQKLAILPKMEDIRLGEQLAGAHAASLNAAMAFSPPKLAIAPFLNVMMSLSASLQLVAEMPAFDQCSICPCG
ncbi:MAG: hypothetical protein AB8B85_17990 [Paracoccaceae bacterium]